MAIRSVDDDSLAALADAIRAKGGTSDPLVFPEGFKTAVEAIQAGGGVDFSYICDTYAVYVKRIIVGANSANTTLLAWNYFSALTDGELLSYVLLSPIDTIIDTYNNILLMCKYRENGVYRYRDGTIKLVTAQGTNYDATLVEGMEYLLISYNVPAI